MKKIFFLMVGVLTLLSAQTAFAQRYEVTGSVTDAKTGDVISFASVRVDGTMTGVSGGADGTYSINVSSRESAVLVFSFVGYKTQEVAVDGRTVVNVALEPDALALKETIVVAYGTATRESFTGSASTVSSETLSKRVVSSVTGALAGTSAGVQVTSSTGDPAAGGSSTIRIRGIGSMYASNSPLYIVDGMPYDAEISDINPNDVESLTVLKDASAAAIYGARGANGVILITTKRPTNQDAKVNVDMKWGSNSRLIPQYDVITDPGQYYETWYKKLYNEQYYAGATSVAAHESARSRLFDQNNGGLGYNVYTVPDGQFLIGTNFKLNPNATLGYDDGEYYYYPDNWYDEVYHNSFRQEYNVSVSGSRNGFTYFASAGYLKNGGIIDNSDYERYTARINADYQAKKWLKVTTSMSYSHSDSKSLSSTGWGSSGNLFYITNNVGPIYPLYVRATGTHEILHENGIKMYDYNQTNFTRPNLVGNAVRDNELNDAHNYADVFTGKWGVVLTPVKGLDLTANVGLSNDNTRYNELDSPFGSASSIDGEAYVSHSRMFAVTNQYLASYATDFGGSKHDFDVLVGYESYKLTSQSLVGENDHLFDPYIGELGNALGSSSKYIYSGTTRYMTEGVLARVQYDFDKRFFVSGSYRRDASSRFAKGHRWGDFGSAGAAWVMSSERWMKNARWIDMLKLKFSYGVQGNDNLGSYFPYADQYSTSYNETTGEYSLSLNYKGNEDLTWESSHALNGGVEFDFFGGRFSGDIEGFQRRTSDMLYYKDVPLSSGNPTGQIPTNVGSVVNNGLEITLTGVLVESRKVYWDLTLNLTHYKNKIVSLDESVSEEGIKGSYYIYEVGGSLYETYMRKYAGVNKETGEAQYYYKVYDENGNYTGDATTTNFTNADQYKCGTTLPKIFGGLGTTFSAFGIDFSLSCSFQLGGKYYDGSYQAMMLTQDNAGMAVHKDILNSWSEENPNSNIPRLDGNTLVGQTAVDRFMISSNYLSLDNITLGYTFPKKWTEKIKIEALRVYFTADNVAVLSARKGVDPRYSLGIGSYTSGSSLNTSSYSAMRNLSGGLSITF